MTLERTECYGPCPIYKVEVRGDGEVAYEGLSPSLIPGHHRSRISKEAVQRLVAEFRKANYFSLKDRYVWPVTDLPTFKTSIEFDGRKKSVVDYMGRQVGMPEAAERLEISFDEIAQTGKWVEGNRETVRSLIAEGWNFQADSEDNRELFANVVDRGPKEVMEFCLRQPGVPKRVLSCGLESAAGKGDLRLARRLLQQGADPKEPPCIDDTKWTVLMRAAQSGKAEMVREILKYDPDVNAKDFTGRTALGSFLERTDANADTGKIVQMLVNAGTDVNSRDGDGLTAAEEARRRGSPEEAELIENAVRTRGRQ